MEEDNERAASVWDGLRRKAGDVSALLSLAGKKKKKEKRKEKQKKEKWKIHRCNGVDKSDVTGGIANLSVFLQSHKQLLPFLKKPVWFVSIKQPSKCQGF